MNNSSKNSLDIKIPYIITGVLFAVIFAICLFTFTFVAYSFSGTALILILLTAGAAAAVSEIIISMRCATISKIKNPDGFNPPRDMFFYIRRMGFITLMAILMSLGVSFAGTFLNGLFGGFVKNMDNSFLRGFILKLPMFAVYLFMIYRMFIRYGFMDAQRKIYNLNLHMQALMIAFIFMVPNAVFDSMYDTATFSAFVVNLQTVFSPNIDVYILDSLDVYYVNENFNIFLVLISVIAAFAIQLGLAWFAYKRGKKIMIKEHIREIDEYETDENI